MEIFPFEEKKNVNIINFQFATELIFCDNPKPLWYKCQCLFVERSGMMFQFGHWFSKFSQHTPLQKPEEVHTADST